MYDDPSFPSSLLPVLKRLSVGGVYVSLINPAKLGGRLVVGEGDVVMVGCAAAKGCVRAIY